MIMTDGEIYLSYKQAKHKDQQIVILAQLNGCSKKRIESIIAKGDPTFRKAEPAKKIPEGYRPVRDKIKQKQKKEQEEKNMAAAQKKMPIPSSVYVALVEQLTLKRERIQELEKMIELRQKEIDDISREIDELKMFIDGAEVLD